MLEEADAQIVGMVRRDVHLQAPSPARILREDDILVIEVEPESLSVALSSLGLKLEEEVHPDPETQEEIEEAPVVAEKETADTETSDEDKEQAQRADIVIQELVVMMGSALVNRSATDIELRTRYGINLLAISRQGHRSIKRLRSTPVQAGDVLLMQGSTEMVSAFAAEHGCLPLATRDIRVPKKGHALLATLVMVIAVATAAFGMLPVAVAFAAGALVLVVAKIIPLRSIYTEVDWPVVVLLGAMLPVAGAMSSTGAADMIARQLMENVAQGHAITALVVILVATMLLTDFMNNAATAAVMCPIALSTANQLGVSVDAFLMAVAVGASCAFLTPIGHQNNTLILGPGGFRFGDYWRMGLPMDILVVLVGVPMLLWVWPL